MIQPLEGESRAALLSTVVPMSSSTDLDHYSTPSKAKVLSANGSFDVSHRRDHEIL